MLDSLVAGDSRVAAYSRAIELTTDPGERDYLTRRTTPTEG